MTINYKGMSKDFNYRIAEITYNEETENELINRMIFFLETVKGWKIDNGVEGWCGIEVNNRAEYNDFLADYKEAKKMIKDCMRYGF